MESITDDAEIIAGKRLEIIRKSLLMSVDTVSKGAGVSKSTILRIEAGEKEYGSKILGKLCNFYVYNKKELYEFEKPVPDWKTIRRRMLKTHPKNSPQRDALYIASDVRLAIEFRLLPTSFLSTPREVKEIIGFFKKRKLSFLGPSISNALDALYEAGLIDVQRVSPKLFRYKKKTTTGDQNKDLHNSVEIEKLNELLTIIVPNLDTQILKLMSSIVSYIEFEPKSRKDIMEYLGFSNQTKNYQRYIEPLLKAGIIMMTELKPKSKAQKYQLTGKGSKLIRIE